MTFSEFAQLLYPYIGMKQNRDSFVIELVENIMKVPVSSCDKELDKDGNFVPLPKLSDTLCRIFNGKRSLSGKNAREILSKLEKERFVSYIEGNVQDDTLNLIKSALREKGIEVADKQVGEEKEDSGVGEACADLFVSILEDCASKQRKTQTKDSQNRPPEAEHGIAPVAQTEVKIYAPAEGVDNISLQEQSEVEQIFRGTNTGKIEFEDIDEDDEELLEPVFYGEYKQKCLKQFEMYSYFYAKPLNPELKEKWGPVSITDEFYKSANGYEIEKFIDITPSELLPMRNVMKKDDVIGKIRNAERFIEHMRPAIDHMMISNENKEIFLAISNFVTLLRNYVDFLKENSNNPDLYSNEFILMPTGDSELEQKANMYYGKLRNLYGQITNNM